MGIKTLYIDFDGIYREKVPHESIYVLTNLYENKYVYNVNSNSNSWDILHGEFFKYKSGIDIKQFEEIFPDSKTMDIHLFTSIFHPLGQWFMKIDDLLRQSIITKDTEIQFSSYCNNSKLFGFEAEGETNGQFLYKKSYYQSFYIYHFLKKRGFEKIVFQRNRSFESNFNFYIRGYSVLTLKVIQILLYKMLVFKRNFLDKKVFSNTTKTIISSRGIIQTQFITNFSKKYHEDITIIVNESSSKPFRNFKVAKKNNNFYYAEGNISFSQLLSEIQQVIRSYRKKEEVNSTFFGIVIDITKALPEYSIKNFHYRTYAHMLINSINTIKRKYGTFINRVISMEMLPPFAHYIKKNTHYQVYQLQTTSIGCVPYPNFLYGDKFIFSDKNTYDRFIELNLEFSSKFELANNIKYLGLKKNLIKKELRTLTYFSQPIYEDEENQLIVFLKEFCIINELSFRVKFHPRAKVPSIDMTGIQIIDSIINSIDVIKNSDMVATRTSSIGADCWYLNAPVLFFVNGIMKSNNISYIPKNYKGTIVNDVSIHELSEMLPSILNDFYNHPLHHNYSIEEERIVEMLLR